MGPTNIALVSLYLVDQQLREAQGRLDSASRGVRSLERRINSLREQLKVAQTSLREQQAQTGQLELEIKSREEHIEKLRTQQQNCKSHKEYQIFLTEINTEKVDKGKMEDQAIKVMEVAEKLQEDVKSLSGEIDAEQASYDATQRQLSERLGQMQGEIDRIKPLRDEAAKAIPASALETFERLCERFEGEAMASIGKPDRRREEYICNSCNMSLVADIYNRLHTRDEIVLCPNCRRLLFIPDDLPPNQAINSKPARKSLAPANSEKVE
jgi:uncharacterized protein